jgi:membrane protein
VSWWRITKRTFSRYSEDKVPRLGAALAYYTTFSLAPLLIIIVAIAGIAFGEDAVRGRLVGELSGLIGEQGGRLIETALRNTAEPSSNLFATIVGVLTLLIGASGVFGELQDAINTIWEVKPKPGRGFKRFICERFFSFAMILGSGFLLLVSLVISAAISAASNLIGDDDAGTIAFWHTVNLAISFLVITGLFAMIFKILPDVKLRWRDVLPGALLTSLLFTFGKFLIGLYLGHSTTASVYGASGALAILLIWAYYSAQILLLGVEFTRAYTREMRGDVAIADNAEPVPSEQRATQGLTSTKEAPAGSAVFRGPRPAQRG